MTEAMKITKANYAERLSHLTQEQKVRFYESLAHILTVVCRAIWAEESITDKEKVEQMKWLNEIQHTVTAKISVERLQSHEWKEQDVIDTFTHYANLCPQLGDSILQAIQDSYRTATHRPIRELRGTLQGIDITIEREEDRF